MSGMILLATSVLCAASATPSAPGKADLKLWAVDPLIKVFPDAQPEKGTRAEAEAARGEHATFQLVVRSDSPLQGLTASISPFKKRTGDGQIEARAPRFVGYVPVDRPTQTPSKDQLRKPPADYPDPLLDVPSLDLEPGRAQPLWITVRIPEKTNPGSYSATLTLTGRITPPVGTSTSSIKSTASTAPTIIGKANPQADPISRSTEITLTKKLTLRVHKAAVKNCRLWVTDWFAMHWPHMEINPAPESDEYYALLRRYAENMAEHRHNVALISPLSLAQFSVAPDGKLAIDFSRFDRWVQTFKDAGVIGRIEGGHIGGRKADWESPFVVNIWQVKDGNPVSTTAAPSSPEADAFYSQFFPALVKHLRERGWLDCYLQHLADEPIPSNIDTYRAMASLARKYAPELKIMEACHAKDLVGAMDVWVPQLNFLHTDFAHYQERQRAGEEVWFYTCVFPQGEYANRFIELPLIKTRLLHWINFRYGITGYLHWGYNHWTQDDPFTHTTRAHPGPSYLPAGDPWIVYPGKNGPLDSIRFEAMRDGIVDHELLSQLAQKNPDKAAALAANLILDFDKYNTDIKTFRKTRHTLLKLVSGL